MVALYRTRIWNDVEKRIPFQGPWDYCQRREKVAWMCVESMTLVARQLQPGGSCLIRASGLVGSYSFNANSQGFLYEASNIPMLDRYCVVVASIRCLYDIQDIIPVLTQLSLLIDILLFHHLTKPQATRNWTGKPFSTRQHERHNIP